MRNADRIRFALRAGTAVLFLCAAAGAAPGEEARAVSGTVAMVDGGILYLKDVRLPDESQGAGSMMFLLTPRTEFYSGLDPVPGGSIADGQLVLVRYVAGPSGNEALLVRILADASP